MGEHAFVDSLILGGPTDVAGFDAEMRRQISNISCDDAPLFAKDIQDIEELIADALKRRCCNGNNDRRAALHMHLRLKNGKNAGPHPMNLNLHELTDLAEIIGAKGGAAAAIKRLANFYARIARLRVRIHEINSTPIAGMDLDNGGIDVNPIIHSTSTPKNSNMDHLLTAYEKNEEKRREKQNENQRELARIMESLIRDDLTEDDLPALEMQVEHIAERGCCTEELRRLKIIEAALEHQRYDKLMAQLEPSSPD